MTVVSNLWSVALTNVVRERIYKKSLLLYLSCIFPLKSKMKFSTCTSRIRCNLIFYYKLWTKTRKCMPSMDGSRHMYFKSQAVRDPEKVEEHFLRLWFNIILQLFFEYPICIMQLCEQILTHSESKKGLFSLLWWIILILKHFKTVFQTYPILDFLTKYLWNS